MARITHLVKSFIAAIYWRTTNGKWRLKDLFNDWYEGQARSDAFRQIYRDAFGDEFAEEADPCGFVTMTDLRNIAEHVNVGEDQTLVDLACGRGGVGMWVARQTGANLIGIDISKVAVEHAAGRTAEFDLDGRARFQVGDFCATGLPGASCHGVMSVDALFFVADKTSSVAEVARILRPGARFVFTNWELDIPLMVNDYRPLLEDAGFQIEIYEETPGWEARQRAVHESVLAQKDVLIEEMGSASARVWIQFAQTELPRLSRMRRIFVVAKKG